MVRVEIASRARQRRRMRIVRAVALSAAAAVVVVGALAWAAWAPFWRIHSVEVVGTQTLATSSIADYVSSQLMGTRGLIFPKDSIFFYPNRALTQSLLEHMPTLASAELRALNFSTLQVEVVERQPKALWCGSQAPVASSSSAACYILDSSGAAYAPADVEGTAYERYYGALAGNALAKQYLTSASFGALSALIDALSAREGQDSIVSIEVDEHSDVRVSFASGFELLFSLSDAGGDVFERFTLALQSDPFKGKQLSDFQYLDLRFGDKLYYKAR